MKYVRGSSWGALASLAAHTLAQFDNWQAHQINTSICTWEQPRVALVRDVVYLDGGDIFWTPGLASGENAGIQEPENYQGIILTYNLSVPFSADSNVTGILLKQELSKAPGGLGNANGASPNYYDGAMLANDAQFFLYGGAPHRNDEQYRLPDQAAYTEYQVYSYGSNKPLFQPGFRDLELPDGVTRYVAYGAAANAPSENKAWYFSGLTSPTHGPIVQSGNASLTASNVSRSLISVDMATQNFQKWSNKTLPASVRGRSNAELVWVPVGAQGILVVLGGVTYPDWASPIRQSSNVTGSQKLDPDFMSVIDVYDIENDVWYKQPASKAAPSASIPSARARGCAVVAAASDFSSFNIYYYGGYDGLHPGDPYFDEVWVLSLPSFVWIKISDGTSSHARAGHKCVSPYPDQMMVFGGATPLAGSKINCLEKGPVLNFNLTSGTWMDSYDPTKFANYGVHKNIFAAIGGDATGGAKLKAPVPPGFANDSLATVFSKPYDQSKVIKYWPYTPESASGQPTGTAKPVSSGGGLPKWAPPVLGVVAAVIFITCAAVLFFLWRRRHTLKASDRSTMDSRRQSMISRIMETLYSPEKRHMSMASVVTPMSPSARDDPTPAYSSMISDGNVTRHEMPDTQLVELDASNTRSELHDTGLTHVEIERRFSHWFRGVQNAPSSPSEASFSPSLYPPSSHPSEIHRGAVGNGSPRMDSPPLGAAQPVSMAGIRPPPLPEVDERGIISPLGADGDTLRGAAEMPLGDVVSPEELPTPALAHSIHGNGPPPQRRHKSTGSSSQASHKSSSTQASKSSSVQHIAFQMKNTESVGYFHKRDGNGQGSGSGSSSGEGAGI